MGSEEGKGVGKRKLSNSGGGAGDDLIINHYQHPYCHR